MVAQHPWHPRPVLHRISANFSGSGGMVADVYQTYPRPFLTAHLDDGIMETVVTNWGNDGIAIEMSGRGLAGNWSPGLGPMQFIPTGPLFQLDGSGRLAIDFTSLQSQIDVINAALVADNADDAVWQARIVTDEGNISGNASAIAALQTALAAANAQITSLQQQLIQLAAVAKQWPQVSAVFAPTGSLTATLRMVTQIAALPFNGTGSLVADAMVLRPIAAFFAGAGGFRADLSGPHAITASWAGLGSMSVNLTLVKVLTASFNGAGSLTATAGLLLPCVPSVMAGKGGFSASVFPALFMQASTMAGTGGLTANLGKTLPATLFAGSGQLAATATLAMPVTAELDGVGTLSIDETAVTQRMAVQVPLLGTGSVAVNEVMALAFASQLSGAGGWLADLIQKSPFIAALLTGQGNMAVNLNNGLAILGNMAGAGGMTPVTLQQLITIQAALTGAGGLHADLFKTTGWQIAANLAGAGALTVADLQKLLGTALFAGVGNWSVNLNNRMSARPVVYAGVGALTANLTQQSGYSTLDATHKAAGITLSGGNLTATAANTTGGSVRGTVSRNSGQRYFEVTISTQPTGSGLGVIVGVVNTSYPSTTAGQFVGYDVAGNSWAVGENSGASSPYAEVAAGSPLSTGFPSLPANGDVIQGLVDFTAGNIWFGVNGNWVYHLPTSGIGDFTFTPGTPLWPAISMAKSPNAPVIIFNPGSSTFVNTPPSGFVAWG